MKHNQSTKARILYLILLFLLFNITFKFMGISLNTAFYGIFLSLCLGYYIFELLTFTRVYSLKDFIYSSFFNGIVFYIFLLFTKNSKVLFGYLGFTFIQNLNRYIFIKIFQKNNRVAILGNGIISNRIRDIIIENPSYDYIGFIENGAQGSLGNIYNIDKIIEKYKIDELVYIEEIEEEKIEEIILKIKLSGVKVMDSITFLEQAEGKVDIETINMDWVIKSSGFNILNSSFEQRIKRTFDIFLGILLLIVGIVPMGITYILVKLDNPKNFFSNPAFFKQKRIGAGGREFNMVKFRSMKVHDPNKFSKYASKNDNRITMVGKFIRKTRLDELPQLINVLRGDMSFVGPRPEWNILGREYEEKINLYKLRYAVKPGLTGWAQVMYPYGANLEDAKRKLEYDIYYIKQQNFILDVIIFFKTIKTVIFGKGM
ncbi:exopolysaccharide biosynthesis polyprenyl glycosylphosphotransferase [Cetobacterium ceti]